MPNPLQRFRRIVAVVAVLVVLSSSGGVSAQVQQAKFNRQVNVGDPAPVWQDLAGVDGKTHSLNDYRDARVLVVVFWCNHCPVAQAYTQRVIEFVKTYRPRGVELAAISVSRFPADSLEKMREHAQTHRFNFAYLHDASQQTGRDYGATCTPHFFVLDKGRKIAYMGAFDDHMTPSKVEHHYVRDAVEALLAGKRPEIAESRQRGCPIEYVDSRQ